MKGANGALTDEARRTESGRGHIALAVDSPTSDPFAGVYDMGPRVPVAATVALAILLHGGMAAGATAAALFGEIFAWHRGLAESVALRLGQTYDIEVPKPEEPPKPEPEPAKEEPKPEPAAVVKEQPKDEPPPPPPAAAEAAKVLMQEPTKDDPLDFTGNTFVQGSGSTYAGGTTQAGGTSKTAVYNPAAVATGVPGGTGTAPAPAAPKVDRSRAASLSGSTDWSDCPFPAEADAEQIDQSFVTIQVKVRPDGSAESVTVVQDPGHGFGREARKCAMRKKYGNALDADGNPIGGQTKPFRVRFQR